MLDDLPELIDLVRPLAKAGESLWDAAQRALLQEAMDRASGCQRCVAAMLRASPRVVNYAVRGDEKASPIVVWRKSWVGRTELCGELHPREEKRGQIIQWPKKEAR